MRRKNQNAGRDHAKGVSRNAINVEEHECAPDKDSSLGQFKKEERRHDLTIEEEKANRVESSDATRN